MGTTAATTETQALRLYSVDIRVLLVLLVGLLAGALAYQAPPVGSVAIGWLGDRLFLDASETLAASTAFHADDLSPDSPTSRSRWMRSRATLSFPNLGSGTGLDITLLAQGWPTDLVDRPFAQPTIVVLANGNEIGSFQPTPGWEHYSFSVLASQHTSANLQLELRASDTFTSTLRGVDPRLKGLRLAEVSVRSSHDSLAFLPPAWPITLQLALVSLLMYLLLLRAGVSTTRTFVVSTFGAGLLGVLLGVWRVWAGALIGISLGDRSLLGEAGLLITPMTLLLGGALLFSWRGTLLQFMRELLQRYSTGQALGYGLVFAALSWLGYALARWSFRFQLPRLSIFQETFPDSLLYGLFGAGLLALTLVRGREGLPRLSNNIVAFLNGRRAAPLLLALLGGIWLGYQLFVVLELPFVGHADYADNAVVARNLLAGRGWVVDYVTQFYQVYPSLTRQQETWPLLQPVWIAASFALFGVSDWAAKIPNLLFNLALLLLVYTAGVQIWNRRVGLTAALLTLTNWVFFPLTIFSTSDLAFVVFSLAAIFLLYRARTARFAQPRADGKRGLFARPWLSLALSGLCTGLMVLQKPSSALIAAGIGLWLLSDCRLQIADWRTTQGQRGSTVQSAIFNAGLWGTLALLVISPYIVRNLDLFGQPIYSTEQYDAWVLGYRGDSAEAWADIYKVYAPELAVGAPGKPDRSWLLRWGFDQTLDKLLRQVLAVRDYLLPPWQDAPWIMSWLAGRSVDLIGLQPPQLLYPAGAWFTLAGVVAAVRARKRLLSVLAAGFVPYTLFLVSYWHANEERYWVMLLPWMALLSAWVLWAGYERLAAIGDGRWAPLGLILVTLALASVVQPSWARIANKLETERRVWQPDLAAYAWIRANLPADAAIMTRTPWQLNWHTERPALMVPNTANRDLILAIAQRYGVRYIAFETLNVVKGDALLALKPLAGARIAQPGAVIEGFTLLYASPTPENRVLIYQLPNENAE